jgi:hypothetical protein
MNTRRRGKAASGGRGERERERAEREREGERAERGKLKTDGFLNLCEHMLLCIQFVFSIKLVFFAGTQCQYVLEVTNDARSNEL